MLSCHRFACCGKYMLNGCGSGRDYQNIQSSVKGSYIVGQCNRQPDLLCLQQHQQLENIPETPGSARHIRGTYENCKFPGNITVSGTTSIIKSSTFWGFSQLCKFVSTFIEHVLSCPIIEDTPTITNERERERERQPARTGINHQHEVQWLQYS